MQREQIIALTLTAPIPVESVKEEVGEALYPVKVSRFVATRKMGKHHHDSGVLNVISIQDVGPVIEVRTWVGSRLRISRNLVSLTELAMREAVHPADEPFDPATITKKLTRTARKKK